MDGMREGLLGVLCISKCNIVKTPPVFPFISVCHKVFCWPAVTTCLTPASLQAVLFTEGGCSPVFNVLCLTMRPSTARSDILTWGVAVILGEKGYQNVSGSHNWKWEISFSTEKILIFSKPNWRGLFLCQSQEGAAEKPEAKWLDFFLLCSAATAVWKKKSNGVGWKQAVSPQLCRASRKSSGSENETWESCLVGLWLQCPVCCSRQPCRKSQTLVHPEKPYVTASK